MEDNKKQEAKNKLTSIYKKIKDYDYRNALKELEDLMNSEYINYVDMTEIKIISSYLKTRIGQDIKTNNETLSYLELQMMGYDELYTLEHMLSYFKEESKKGSKYDLKYNIDPLEFIYSLGEMIKKETPIESTYVDTYMVSFDTPIAFDHGVETGDFKVITIANTKNVVYFYPVTKDRDLEENEDKNKDLSKNL